MPEEPQPEPNAASAWQAVTNAQENGVQRAEQPRMSKNESGTEWRHAYVTVVAR